MSSLLGVDATATIEDLRAYLNKVKIVEHRFYICLLFVVVMQAKAEIDPLSFVKRYYVNISCSYRADYCEQYHSFYDISLTLENCPVARVFFEHRLHT